MSDRKKFLSLTSSGEAKEIDFLWLRDHCRCDECYNKKTHQLTSNIIKIVDTCQATDVTDSDDVIKVKWNDGHNSTYSKKWLLNASTLKCSRLYTLWDKKRMEEMMERLKVPMEDYLKGDDCVKKLLSFILETGIGVVTNVPATEEATRRVVEKITHVQKTYFGEMWEVTNDLTHEDFAYTNVALEVHNDNTYLTDAAGLQVFHMLLHNGTGGETQLVDGFNAALKLKSLHPEAFDVLTKTPVEAEYVDQGVHYSHIDSVIKLHPITKSLHQIRFNLRDRAVLNSIGQHGVREFYDAYVKFSKELLDGNNEYRITLAPGDVIFIDNWRVLHGRAAYTGLRKLCGCYVGRSDWLSRAKALGLSIL